MAKILSQEEIDALLNNVSEEVEPSGGLVEEERKISLYDFKHPNLVSKEQLRLLENIHEDFVRNFSVFLSAQLRMIVEMNLVAVDQVQYSEFIMSIALPGAIYVGSINNPFSPFVLEISPQLSIFIVEKLFGGAGKFITEPRPVSVIEQRIIRRVIDHVAKEVSKIWKPIKEIECTIDRFENNPEFVQIVPSGEPVVVISMGVKIHGTSTMINICYPYTWISNILSTPKIQDKIFLGVSDSSEDEKSAVKINLKRTTLSMRAILGNS
ncbi:flagellar motor switch protein FliM, partial [Caldithrix abyssi]|nr:flagellar motor switch protein FliM [Caldithrix abyssi]